MNGAFGTRTDIPVQEKVLFEHGVARLLDSGHVFCRCSKFHPFQGLWAHSCHQALMWREACTIHTVEQLNVNWPMGTLIQEIHDGSCCGDGIGCDFYPPLWEMAFQMGWSRAGEKYDDDAEPRLPALLLWHPEWGNR